MNLKMICFATIAASFAGSAGMARAAQMDVLEAENSVPTISPMAILITENGEQEGTELSGDAPLKAHLEANAQDVGSYAAIYEWRITRQGDSQPYLIRYEEDTDYTFTESGAHLIELYATFINGADTVAYAEEYWNGTVPITITVSDSKLEMPNAFSPNGDGINDVYKAKSTWRSIIEFHATIYNRWGQKLFEWTDPASGWDGRYRSKEVKQGTYFVEVKARGADGRRYNIRRDVNLLRRYTEETDNQ